MKEEIIIKKIETGETIVHGYYNSLKKAVENNKDFMSEADLSGADLRGADLSGADLRGADLSGADLTFANLEEANLERTILYKANLEEAILVQAYMEDTDLRKANMEGTDTRGVQPSEITTRAKEIAKDLRLKNVDWDTKYNIAIVCLEDGDNYEDIIKYISKD
jgi:uncharacterized protein YjbI with pentapeptide repeats